MNINIDSVIEMVVYLFDCLTSFTVTIGGASIGLVEFFLAFILVDAIVLFIRAFTSSKGGDNSD